MSASSKNIDFSGVKDGGNFNRRRIPAGDYLATITKIEDAEAKDGIFQYLVSVKINKLPASVFPYYCKLQENQLWKLRNLLIAAGLTIPKKRMKVDPNRVINRVIGVTIEDDEYDGKEQSTIAGIFPAAELADGYDGEPDEPEEEEVEEDEEDILEAEVVEEDDEEEEEEEAVDPLDSMNRTELKAALAKVTPGFKARKSQTDDDLRTLLRDAQNDGADEEEEEVAPPVKKAKATKKAPAKASKKKAAAEVSDEELEELDIDDL